MRLADIAAAAADDDDIAVAVVVGVRMEVVGNILHGQTRAGRQVCMGSHPRM